MLYSKLSHINESTTLMDLPKCQYRKAESEGIIECSCPLMNPKILPANVCLVCPYADEPNLGQKAINFTKAAAKHVRDGLVQVSDEQLEARLNICRSNQCGFYQDEKCKHQGCGCFLKLKAKWRSETCPMDLWPKITDGV